MYNLQNCKITIAQLGTQATNATAASDAIDTLGYHACTLVVGSPKATASGTQRWTSLVVQEADDTAATSFSTISALNYTTTTGQTLTLPSNSSTSAFGSLQININLNNGRKRYLRVVSQPPSTDYHTTSIVAILDRAEKSPTSATEAGVGSRVNV